MYTQYAYVGFVSFNCTISFTIIVDYSVYNTEVHSITEMIVLYHRTTRSTQTRTKVLHDKYKMNAGIAWLKRVSMTITDYYYYTDNALTEQDTITDFHAHSARVTCSVF